MRAQKLVVVEIRTAPGADSVEATLAAMRDGADVIYQAPLADERWHGRADFLRKVARPSKLGGWSYEVTDAKLATETRAGTILQLCVYSSLLERLQGANRRRRTSSRRTITSSPRAIGSPTTRRTTGS